MSSEALVEARRLADQDRKEMPLHELRSARRLTQQRDGRLELYVVFPDGRVKLGLDRQQV